MDYNSSRSILMYKEYGRNIQKFIAHALTVEDDEKRNKLAKGLVELMGQMHPTIKSKENYKQILWDHLFIMSDFKLQVESPYPIPTAETARLKPKPMAYPKNKIKLKHYGKNIERLIEKAKKTENEETKEFFVENIVGFMKMVYKNNQNEVMSDDGITSDFKKLTNGELTISEDANLNLLARHVKTTTKSHDNKNRSSSNKKYSKKSNNRSYRKY